MVLHFRFVSQGEKKERSFPRKDGTTGSVVSLQLRLRAGTDEFFCDVEGADAVELANHPMNPDFLYYGFFQLRIGKWKSEQTGEEREGTFIKLLRHAVL